MNLKWEEMKKKMKKNRKNTAFRLLKYSMGGYKLQFVIVLITIIKVKIFNIKLNINKLI